MYWDWGEGSARSATALYRRLMSTTPQTWFGSFSSALGVLTVSLPSPVHGRALAAWKTSTTRGVGQIEHSHASAARCQSAYCTSNHNSVGKLGARTASKDRATRRSSSPGNGAALHTRLGPCDKLTYVGPPQMAIPQGSCNASGHGQVAQSSPELRATRRGWHCGRKLSFTADRATRRVGKAILYPQLALYALRGFLVPAPTHKAHFITVSYDELWLRSKEQQRTTSEHASDG